QDPHRFDLAGTRLPPDRGRDPRTPGGRHAAARQRPAVRAPPRDGTWHPFQYRRRSVPDVGGGGLARSPPRAKRQGNCARRTKHCLARTIAGVPNATSQSGGADARGRCATLPHRRRIALHDGGLNSMNNALPVSLLVTAFSGAVMLLLPHIAPRRCLFAITVPPGFPASEAGRTSRRRDYCAAVCSIVISVVT